MHSHSCTFTHIHAPNAEIIGEILVPKGAAQLGSPPSAPFPQPFWSNPSELEPREESVHLFALPCVSTDTFGDQPRVREVYNTEMIRIHTGNVTV